MYILWIDYTFKHMRNEISFKYERSSIAPTSQAVLDSTTQLKDTDVTSQTSPGKDSTPGTTSNVCFTLLT